MNSNANKTAKSTNPAKKRKLSTASCPYMKNVGGKAKLVGDILSKATDIEELAKVGGEQQACPYYAARLFYTMSCVK